MMELMCAAVGDDGLRGDAGGVTRPERRGETAKANPEVCPLERALGCAPDRTHTLNPAIDATVGVWHAKPAEVVDSTTEKAFVLTPLDGVVEVAAGGTLEAATQIAAGEIFVVSHATAFRLRIQRPATLLGMVFSESLIRMSQLPVLARYPGHYELRNGVNGPSPLAAMLARALDSELAAHDQTRASMSATLMLALLEAVATDPIFAERHAAASNFTETAIARAMRHIDENLSGDLSLSAIARASGVSPYHLSRSFSAAVGANLYSYIRRRRVQAACVLLAETTLCLAEVAFECGFSSQSAMNTMFRKLIDCTPLQYRNRAWRREEP